jgi:hypothetical protein
VTQLQAIPGVLNALGDMSGQPDGPAPFASAVSRLKASAGQPGDWELVSAAQVQTWLDDQAGAYTDDLKAQLKEKLDALAGVDTGDAPEATTTVGSIVDHIVDITNP